MSERAATSSAERAVEKRPLTRSGQLYRFIGPTVTLHLAVSIATGISLFAVELAFAVAIQLFLVVLEIASPEMLSVPTWLPTPRIGWVLPLLIVSALIRGLCVWAQDYLRTAAQSEFRHLQRTRILSWVFASKSMSAARLTSLFGESANQAASFVKFFQVLLVQITVSGLLVASLLAISPLITLSSFLVIGLVGFPLKRTINRVHLSGKGLAAEWEATQERLSASIKNLLLLRIYGVEQLERERIQGNLSAHMHHTLSYIRNATMLSALPVVLGTALVCGIAYLAKRHELVSAGALISYFYLFLRSITHLSQVSYGFSNLAFEHPQFQKIYEWWKENQPNPTVFPHQEQRNGRTLPLTLIPLQAPIGWRTRRLGFQYSQAQGPVLECLDLEITPGSATVIVGPSGAGKSTLLNLLLGELEPAAGEIELILDGQATPLSRGRERLLANVGYVGPESWLIEGSIAQNLTYGLRHSPTPRELEAAIQSAECQFIYELPQKLEHHITEQGHGLSAGQKQRLALARALLRHPKALILDEATANLDADTESRIVETFGRLKGKLTIIGVTHRSALLKIADNVLRME